MTRYIAFLRAINVGGHTLKMEALRALFEDLALSKVETFIASGNVIFETRTKTVRDVAVLEQKIEVQLHKNLGYEVATFLRTDAELQAIAAHEAFSEEALRTALALNVAFLKQPLDSSARQLTLALKTDADDFHIHDREIYWLCRMKQSDSRFTNAVLEKTLKRQATMRGISTIRKLAAKYPADAR